jgi:hypothetical protein
MDAATSQLLSSVFEYSIYRIQLIASGYSCLLLLNELPAFADGREARGLIIAGGSAASRPSGT